LGRQRKDRFFRPVKDRLAPGKLPETRPQW
jgi:hypothetical protein